MKLGRKELVMSIFIFAILLIAGFNLSVLATSGNEQTFNYTFGQNNTSNNLITISNNTNTITPGVNNNNENTQENTIKIVNKTENANTPDKAPNTGVEDLPWVVIGVCVISAIFAYKKIKEYNID